ncbi:MAG: class I SAM-dependent methyltransferase [Thermaerobacterales bacterium]
MKLSARLLKLAQRVPEDTVVVDVGTDHALLPIYLVATGRCRRAIAVEASGGPFRKADQSIRQFGLQAQIDLRLGDGLSVVRPGEADVLVIAGMGGATMSGILSAEPATARSLPLWLLQPFRGSARLRRYLVSRGYRLVHEELVRDSNTIYEMIEVRPGEERIEDEVLYEVGPRLLERRDPLLAAFLTEKIQYYRRLLLQVGVPHSPRAQLALEGFQAKIRRLGAVLSSLKRCNRSECQTRRE